MKPSLFINFSFLFLLFYYHSPIQKTGGHVPKISSTDSFLIKPFDLYKFKKKEGESNSGGRKKMPYYFKPAYQGMYYAFFMFSHMKGYLGTRKDFVIRSENGLTIITYKPLSKYQDQYLDPTEELIEVKAMLNNFNLPELAFVGLDTLAVKKRLGKESFQKENCLVYTYADKALILKLEGGYVRWLKYVHLKKPLSPEQTPEKLYSQ